MSLDSVARFAGWPRFRCSHWRRRRTSGSRAYRKTGMMSGYFVVIVILPSGPGEVRREPLRLLVPLVRGLADRGIRMDVEQESALALKFRESGQEAVVGHEEVLDGPRTAASEDLLETLPAFRQARSGLFPQGLRIGREQVPRGRERTRIRPTVSLRRRSARGHGATE